MKKNKGITLIALIITIIIMLILVAVSVNVLIKSNLIGTAEKAVDKYKTASEEEANGGTIEINGKKYASIEDYIEGKEAITEVHNWERTGDNLTCKHCNRTVTIGQQLNYKETGIGTSKISGDMSGVSQGIADGRFKASSYGTNGEQTINKDDNTKWVVLGAEDVNKNGTNETLLLTTKAPTTEKIVLYGVASYNNCIKEINRMCKELYGEEAEGMTIEDVNNCLAYTPAGGMYYQNGKNNSIGNLTTKLKNIPTWDAIKDNHQTPDGVNTEEALGEYELNGYYYYLSEDGTYLVNDAKPEDTSNTITTATRDLIFGTDADYYYWLASRGVYAISNFANFGPVSVGGGYADSYGGLFGSSGVSYGAELSLRAVVSLRSDIPAVVTDSGSEPS